MSSRAVLLAAIAVAGCGPGGEDPPLDCIDPMTPAISTTCAPLYVPTFDNVYTMTLAPKCAGTGAACHSASGNKGEMTLSSIDRAYEELLEPEQTRVVPGDPACSEMIIRTTASDQSIKMPPGTSLSMPEKCALVQWVANGAQR
jgi:hypothetical protein